LLLSRRIDFFTLLTTLCGITFIGEADGDGESLLTEGAIVNSLVDDSDDVVDAADDDECG
jgi:hypothetical protein